MKNELDSKFLLQVFEKSEPTAIRKKINTT